MENIMRHGRMTYRKSDCGDITNMKKKRTSHLILKFIWNLIHGVCDFPYF
jgi:hypothetical protein